MIFFIIWLTGYITVYFFARREFRKDNEWTLKWKIRTLLIYSPTSWLVLLCYAVFVLKEKSKVKVNWDKKQSW